jgi:hypothetical protein
MNSRSRKDSPTVWIIRWLARLTSLVSVTLILLFLTSDGWSRVTGQELIGLMFFPFGVVLGMLLSWKFEVRGSVVSLASLLAFYLVYGLVLTGRPEGWWFLVFTAPAALFLMAGLLSNRRRRVHQFS